MKSREKRKPSTMEALFPILTMLILLGVGIGKFDLPAEPLIVLTTFISGIQAVFLGYSYNEIMEEVSLKIKSVWGALLILVIVGFMIGSLMISGTIPMMIYYGLKLINPNYLAVTAFLLTAIVSVLTGTSWGSAGTIGVAFMGVAIGMNANLALVAGAVVSGAYFGDKLSPLSDTTNLSSAVCGVDLYEHIKNQMWTTGFSAIVAVIFYFFLGGVSGAKGAEIPQAVNEMLSSLDKMFNWNILLIVPLAIVLIGSIKKLPTIPVMLVASIVALINAGIFQGTSLNDCINATINGFNVGTLGFEESSVSADLVKLLTRGGMMAMMNTCLLYTSPSPRD